MLERRRKRSSTSILLIISGIDMLSAALVCSIVLFVVLVGGQANDGSLTGSGQFASPALLDVYWPKGTKGPNLRGQNPDDHDSTVANSDPYYQFLGGPELQSRYYVLDGESHQLSFTGIQHPFAFVFYPANGAPIRILVGCQPLEQMLTFSFFDNVRFAATCSANDNSTLLLPALSHIRLYVPSGEQTPPDWQAEQTADTGANVPAMVTLRSKMNASPTPLKGRSRIVQVLE